MATTKITSPELFDLTSLDSALQLPSGTTAQRPTSPSTGEWRYNTDNNLIEFYDGGTWIELQDEDLPPLPSENFNTVLYTGNGTSQSITGVGFQPDFVWIKERSNVRSHRLVDSSRGATKHLSTNLTNAEVTTSTNVTSLDSDGFSIANSGTVNTNAANYVAWCWKLNGGTTSTNTEGSITSTVQANTKAGFSIVQYSGNGTTGSIGHGLNSAPEMIIVKSLGTVTDWAVYNESLAITQAIKLNSTDGAITWLSPFNQSRPTASTFPVGGSTSTNTPSSTNFVAYCFHSVSGYSKFGSYTGNGSTNGPIIETGFEPAFLIIKRTDIAGAWQIFDNKRNTTNPRYYLLQPQASDAETDLSSLGLNGVGFYSNGFQLLDTNASRNASGGTYFYMVFASDPSPEPTLANSFYQISYTGNGATRSFTGFGFQPMFSWIKRTDGSRDHIFTTWAMLSLYNRTGANDFARTNATSITSSTQQIISYDPDGVTMGNYVGVNYNNTYDYIGWFWEGSTLPTINNDGSKQTVISVNKAAGMSVIHYSGSTGGATLGHGLDQTPEFIYYWPYSLTNNKQVKSESIGFDTNRLFTNTDGAQSATSDFPVPPTSSVITVSGGLGTNYAGHFYNMMVFHSVDGFSKFGSYTGTGAAGNTVNIGFQPTFVMLKSISVVGNWVIIDSSYADSYLLANSANGLATLDIIDFNSTGFELKGTSQNALNETYQFVCFKVN